MTPTLITKVLKETVNVLVSDLGFLSPDILGRLLCAAGVVVLLVAKVNPNIIKIIGC